MSNLDIPLYSGAELSLIDRFMSSKGYSSKKWLLGTRLTPENLEDGEAYLSMADIAIIYRNILRICPEPDIAIRFGKAMNISMWGSLSQVMISAETLNDALIMGNQYRQILHSSFSLSPILKDKKIIVSLIKDAGTHHPVNEIFSTEMLLGIIATQISNLIQKPFKFDSLNLSYPPPVYEKSYSQLTNSPVNFNCDISTFTISTDLLETPLPFANKYSWNKAKNSCANELQDLQKNRQNDLVWCMRRYITQNMEAQPSVMEAAADLSLTVRTLTRKLQSENTTYRLIMQECQREKALLLILDPSYSIKAISIICGYKNVGSFSSAFKRWMNCSPAEYRSTNSRKQSSLAH